MNVTYRHEIPMGHRLQNHKGKCRFLHGHNYAIRVAVSGSIDVETGMIIDFSELKKAVRKVLDRFDHAFVLEKGDNCLREVNHDEQNIIYTDFPPTAENLAQYWSKLIQEELPRRALRVYLIVGETRDCEAAQ